MHKMSGQTNPDRIAVRWIRSGHRHNNVVHLVSKTTVTAHPDRNGRVVVRWLRKGKELDIWEGVLADAAEDEVDAQCSFSYVYILQCSGAW